MQIRISSKGKEQTEIIHNVITEGKWQTIQFSQTRSVKKGVFAIRMNGIDMFSEKMIMPSKESLVGGKLRVCCEGFIVGVSFGYKGVGFFRFTFSE